MKKPLLFFFLSFAFTKLAHAEIKDYALIKIKGCPSKILLFGECHKGTEKDAAQQRQMALCLQHKKQMRRINILIESPLPTQHTGGKLSVADTQTGSLFSPGIQSTKPRCSSSFICSQTSKNTEGTFYDERDNAPFSVIKLIVCSFGWKYSYPKQAQKADVESIFAQENFSTDMENFKNRCIRLLKDAAPTSLVNIFQKALAGHKPFSYSFEHFYKLTTYIAHIADAAFLAKILTMQKTGPVVFFGGASHTRFLRYVLKQSGANVLRRADPKYGAVKPYKIRSLFYLLDKPKQIPLPILIPQVITRAKYSTIPACCTLSPSTKIIPSLDLLQKKQTQRRRRKPRWKRKR